MPSYRITASFDIDNVPNEVTAQDIADTVEDTLSERYGHAFISGDSVYELLGHRISNVQTARPAIIANEDPIYGD
jgi:hypothetical protein